MVKLDFNNNECGKKPLSARLSPFILSVVGADLSVQSVARCKIIGLRLGGCCSADKLLLLFYLVLEFVLILTKQYNIEYNNTANTLKWEKLTDFILENEDNMSVTLLAQKNRQLL